MGHASIGWVEAAIARQPLDEEGGAQCQAASTILLKPPLGVKNHHTGLSRSIFDSGNY